MLIKDNKQHLTAFMFILDSCSTVRVYDFDDLVTKCKVDALRLSFEHDNMTQILALLWAEHKGSIHVKLSGKWYASIKPTINEKYAAFDLILTSNDKRRNTSVFTEHYNSMGGYWYTPSHELGKTGMKALNSVLMASLRVIVSAFNRAYYIR